MRLFLFILVLSSSAFALETDNYLVWGKELRDSSPHINRFFREKIENSLQKITNHGERSCIEMTEFIARDFASFLVHDNPVENWLFSVLTPDEMSPTDIHYVEESIYRGPYRFYIPWFGLAPNIQVNDFYFGTDKLSHFASTGMIYFKIFQRQLKKAKTALEAEKAAIDWGIRDEKSVHGYWASGVFSYADLEANYQGLKFYRRFCETDSPYLRKSSADKWTLALGPNIEEYVNGFWDETYELSHFLPENWKKVAMVLRDEYCQLKDSSPVKKRFSHYRRSRSTESRKYLETLRTSGNIPSPQSVSDLCSAIR